MSPIIFKNKINRYLAKEFLVRFLQVLAVFWLIIFLINFIEALDKTTDSEVSIFIVAFMAFLQNADFINDISPSLVLLAAIITFFTLSIKSEITIMRGSGYSLWHIVAPIATSSFLLGVFWVTIFGPISIVMMEKFNSLEGKYVKRQLREVVSSASGIWIKQDNLNIKNEEIIIRAKKVYKKNIELENSSIWFINKKNKFYKRIDANKVILLKGNWFIENGTVNDFENLNKKQENIYIKTNLEPDFIRDKVVSNFQNVKLFSIFSLPHLINSLQDAGFQSSKFRVYYNNLILKPLLFTAMSLIACFFGINNFRSSKVALMIFLGMICGLGFYITLSFIAALGASKILPVFTSTWVSTLISLAIGVLLIYKKENG